MKKILWISTVILLNALAGPHWDLSAEEAGPVQADRPATTGEPRLEIQAGVAGFVQGEVKATTPPEKIAHSLKSGDKILMGDKIETGAGGQLQILLLDQTVFTLGPLSTITIDEFVYDPMNAGNKAGMVKGIFRAVSGKVAQKKQVDATETSVLLSAIDEMDQKSQQAAQDRTQSSAGSARR